MKIAVVGTGYVGLVVGACLAENGNTVICVDKDTDKISTLEAGKIPIYEPGLEEMVRRNHSEERLTFTTDLPGAVKASEIVFIAVGTPQGEDGAADHALLEPQASTLAVGGCAVGMGEDNAFLPALAQVFAERMAVSDVRAPGQGNSCT